MPGLAAAPFHRSVIVSGIASPHSALLEWLQYHRALGFDHVYLYCTDDDPAPAALQAAPYGELGFASFIHAPGLARGPAVLMDFLRHHQAQCGWVIKLSVHEFLCLPEGGTIGSFLDSLPPHWECVQFNLLPIGTSLDGPQTGALLPRCTRSSEHLVPLLRPLTRTDRINPFAALAMMDDQAWLHWDEHIPDLLAVDVLGHPARLYRREFPAEAMAYLTDPSVRDRILARGVLCHILPPDPARSPQETARLTATDFPHLAARAMRSPGRAIRASGGGLPNLALGRPAQQSSVCQYSRCTSTYEDAAGALSGRLTGKYQFHTGKEAEPWWMVDLQQLAELREIRLYNREDVGAERCARLSLRVSLDGKTWQEIHRRSQSEPFGGVISAPLIWQAEYPVFARHLRLVVLGETWFHLDRVEVYGLPLIPR